MSNGSFINRAACRKFILEEAKRSRLGWECKFVSKQALDDLNFKVMRLIIGAVKQHPTKGVTFREMQ